MNIFLETEQFDSLGGWTVETQCREAMGSFWIFAHGCGRPVADASTSFETDHPAKWHVRVRTRDWTAVWKRGTPAGRFLILFDGRPLETELGTNGPEWSWQYAGCAELPALRRNVVARVLQFDELAQQFIARNRLVDDDMLLHRGELLWIAHAVDAGDGSDDNNIGALQQSAGSGEPGRLGLHRLLV